MNIRSSPCLAINVPADCAQALIEQLFSLGASAVEERDSSTMIAERDKEQCKLIAGFSDVSLRDQAETLLGETLPEGVKIRALEVSDTGWSTRWREYFEPVILNTLQIITPWMEPPRLDRISLVIDPGQAFGTGGHATTRLILKILEHRAWHGSSMLDIGTGSGILAIAAIKLGAEHVTAVDIDEEALAAAKQNAAVNGVDEQIDFHLGMADLVRQRWPVVLANIELKTFAQIAAPISSSVAQGGDLVLSGLLTEQVEACLALWPGFRLIERRDEEGWSSLVLKRSA